MRKQLIARMAVSIGVLFFLSFKPMPLSEKPGSVKKTFTGVFRSKTAVSSANQTLSVSFTVEAGVGTISEVRVYDASTCSVVSTVGYTGGITYMFFHGAYNYVANVSVDINGTDYVLVYGILGGASICEA